MEFRADPIPLSGAMKPLKRELRRPYIEAFEKAHKPNNPNRR